MGRRKGLRGAATALPAAASLLVAGLAGQDARAEVKISGTGEHLVLQADNASLPEIVAAAQTVLHVDVILSGTIDRQFTGAYSGSLRRILGRLLDGVDHVVKPAAGGMNIVILAPGDPRTAPASAAVRLVNGESGTRQAAAVPIRLAEGPINAAAAGPDSPQGWIPSEPIRDAASPSAAPVRLAAGPKNEAAAEPESLQGWMPTQPIADAAPPAPAQPEATRPVTPGIDQAEPEGGMQGWVPASADSVKQARAPEGSDSAAAPAAPPAPELGAPQVSPFVDEMASDVQGFMPRGNPSFANPGAILPPRRGIRDRRDD